MHSLATKQGDGFSGVQPLPSYPTVLPPHPQLVDRKSAAFLAIADRLGVPVVVNSASMLLDIDETWSCSVPAPYSGQYGAVRSS